MISDGGDVIMKGGFVRANDTFNGGAALGVLKVN